MMYQDKFVVAIKAGGKILRETKDLVHLPFGSEFSVLVKNLNSRRAKFRLHIDGADVLDGTDIVVNANSEVEVKRFIRNGNMDEGNAFKFIERTAAIEDGPRGIRADDGIVRVEYWFEKEKPVYVDRYVDRVHYRDWWYDRHPIGSPYFGTYSDNSVKLKSAIARGAAPEATYSATNVSAIATSASLNSVSQSSLSSGLENLQNDAGITVAGSKVEQKFTPVYSFDAEAVSQVIVLRIVGKKGNVEVAQPVTVKTKQKCTTCGKVNKATAKFCSDCGTALELI